MGKKSGGKLRGLLMVVGLALAILSAGGGCGGKPVRDEAAAAASRFLTALAEGDAEAACSLMTAEARQSVIETIQPGLIGGESVCVQQMNATLARLHQGEADSLRFATARDIRIAGSRARVVIPELGGQLDLVEIDGVWRLAALDLDDLDALLEPPLEIQVTDADGETIDVTTRSTATESEPTGQAESVSPVTESAQPQPAPSSYRAKIGDTLESIAERFDVDVADLRALNPNIDPVAIRKGQRIRLR